MVVDESLDVAELYRHWAQVEARGSSAVYEQLALEVARSPQARALLLEVPAGKRQPNLLFGAMRWHNAPVADPPTAVEWLGEHWPQVKAVVLARRTQTNEVARCAALLPALALLPEPLAVIEVGASAGLCLLYDAWRYDYRGPGVEHVLGDATSPVTLSCSVSGPVPLPRDIPRIAWRAGLDLDPIDPADPDARRWLQTLVWPEQVERAHRLQTALDVAASAPPRVITADLQDGLADLVSQAPADSTVVVTHSATLAYLHDDARTAFLELVDQLGVHRLGLEGHGVLPRLLDQLPAGTDVGGQFLVSLDDAVLGLAQPHGGSLTWL